MSNPNSKIAASEIVNRVSSTSKRSVILSKVTFSEKHFVTADGTIDGGCILLHEGNCRLALHT